MKHITHRDFHREQILIELIGVGGTGSLVLSGLVRLHLAMLELGHPHGLKVRVWDNDTVSAANIGRQLFVESEIGMNKAICLVNRYNLHFGLQWEAIAERFRYEEQYYSYKLFIACVDSRKSRREIFNVIKQSSNRRYCIDAGNDDYWGQVVCGDGSKELPFPYKRFPELVNTKKKEIQRASCSLAEALNHQELFINQWMATGVLELLWQLFRKGGLNYCGYFINLANGKVNPIQIK